MTIVELVTMTLDDAIMLCLIAYLIDGMLWVTMNLYSMTLCYNVYIVKSR